MYPDNPNLMYSSYVPLDQDKSLGKVRETFAINQLQNTNLITYYSQKGDLHVNDFIFEIGGPSNKDTQIRGKKNAYILSESILTGSKLQIPLYLIGFLY